jgi:hypothetical protein
MIGAVIAFAQPPIQAMPWGSQGMAISDPFGIDWCLPMRSVFERKAVGERFSQVVLSISRAVYLLYASVVRVVINGSTTCPDINLFWNDTAAIDAGNKWLRRVLTG